MKDESKTKQQLVKELAEMRQRIAELGALETERKLAEEALRESEEQYRILVETMNDGLAVQNGSGIITFVNDRICEMLGYSRDEMIGHSALEFLDAVNRNIIRGQMSRRREGEQAPYEVEFTKKNGQKTLTRVSPQFLFDAKGNFAGSFGIVTDITERKQMEEALAQRATQLALLNNIGGRIASVLELDSVLDRAARLVQESFGHHHVALFTIDRERGELLLRASAGDFAIHLPPDHRTELGQGLVGWVGRHGEKLLVNDVSADPRYVSFYPDEMPTQSELSVPIRVGEEVVGVLDIQSPRLNAFDANDVMVMEALAGQIAVAIQNARLYEAEHAAREQLRDLAGYLETAREEERTYIAREIHDEFGQTLTALKMDLAWLNKRLPADKPRLVEKVNAMSDLIDSTIQTVRRIATDLRPGVLDHLGLVAAIEWQAQEFVERAGLDCELLLSDKEIVLDPDLATAIFRIFQETLTNIARHAEATEIRVKLEERPGELVLAVQDNGRGITESHASGSKSLGLIGMQERARSWGGDVTFQTVPGQRTTVIVRVPMASAKKEGEE
jgi:PAS domain S-box-containing protein